MRLAIFAMRRSRKFAMVLGALAALAAAQDSPGRRVPSVIMAPAGITAVTRGEPGTVDLAFRVGAGFHVNSNTPRSDFLIPTTLKLDPPADIVVEKITYPPGIDSSFPFAPDEKLNVYSGDFSIGV